MSTKLRLTTASGQPEPMPSKLYFRIGEVAGLVGVEPHVLRYWEREFRAIRPTKSSKGQRVYSRRDVENLLRVRALLYEEGFTIAGARKKLARKDQPAGEPAESASPEVAARSLEQALPADAEPASGVKAPTGVGACELPPEPTTRGVAAAAVATAAVATAAFATAAFATATVAGALAEPAPSMGAVRASLHELRAELELLLDELGGD